MPASLDMPSYCFDVILARMNGEAIPKCIEKYPNIPNENYPLFVTWKKGYNKDLRGCIGTFSRDLSLHHGLHDYAQNSAFKDSRFQPISHSEVSALHCGVSILVKFEPAENYRDWIIGIHGIRIDFQQYGRRLSAVYLPEVAEEQGWEHTETIDHLMRKGGFEGHITEADRFAISIERFQSEKVNLSFDEYVLYKKQKGLPIPITSHKNGFFKNHRRH